MANGMTLNDYQEATFRTWKYGNFDNNSREALSYLTMGLTGEAGEVAEFVKKWLWHSNRKPEEDLIGELGDVLWYLARLADQWGLSLSEVAEHNLAKLAARHSAG